MENNRHAVVGNIIAIVALVLSVISIATQFFIERYKLFATVYDSRYENGNVTIKVLFQNDGNHDVAILNADLLVKFVNVDTVSINELGLTDSIFDFRYIGFRDLKDTPLVVRPHEHLYKEYQFTKYAAIFSRIEEAKRIALKADFVLFVNFLNKKGNNSVNYIDIGQIKYDTTKKQMEGRFEAMKKVVYSECTWKIN